MTDYALTPADVPEEVWEAVAKNYSGNWDPAPEHHSEYRDVRVAIEAYKARLRKILFHDAALSGGHRMQRLMTELEPGPDILSEEAKRLYSIMTAMKMTHYPVEVEGRTSLCCAASRNHGAWKHWPCEEARILGLDRLEREQ